MTPSDPAFHRLLDAIAFAARAHRGQVRKDSVTPYHSHVFRVCLIVRHVFGVDDAAVLTAAVLHDTIEDTTTDFDDIEERYGPEIAAWVALLSKDKRQRDDQRERDYCDHLRSAPWQVKICKLADIYDNLTDSATSTRTSGRALISVPHIYLDALADPKLPPVVQRPSNRVGAARTIEVWRVILCQTPFADSSQLYAAATCYRRQRTKIIHMASRGRLAGRTVFKTVPHVGRFSKPSHKRRVR